MPLYIVTPTPPPVVPDTEKTDVTPIETPKPIVDTKVTGDSEGTLVDVDPNTSKLNPGISTKGPGDKLSRSMRKFNERQEKKKKRVEGRQERKDIRRQVTVHEVTDWSDTWEQLRGFQPAY